MRRATHYLTEKRQGEKREYIRHMKERTEKATGQGIKGTERGETMGTQSLNKGEDMQKDRDARHFRTEMETTKENA